MLEYDVKVELNSHDRAFPSFRKYSERPNPSYVV